MSDIYVHDKAGLDALPVGARLQRAGHPSGHGPYVRTEEGISVGSFEYTTNHVATKRAPLRVTNPEILGGPFAAKGDTVKIVKRFTHPNRSSIFDGKLATISELAFGKTYVTLDEGKTSFPVRQVEVIEQAPEPLIESLAELLPFYIADPEVLDELPDESVVIPLTMSWFPKVKVGDAGRWSTAGYTSDDTTDLKRIVKLRGALVVSIGSESFLPELPDFN